MCVYFQPDFVTNFADAKKSNLEYFKKFFHSMLNNGVYLPPSQFESWFISTALGEQEIDKIVSASLKGFQSL